MMSVSVDCIVVAEVFACKIYKYFHDEMPCSDIQMRDIVFAYEVQFPQDEVVETAAAAVASDEKMADAVTDESTMEDDAQIDRKDTVDKKCATDGMKQTSDIKKKWALAQVVLHIPFSTSYASSKAVGFPRVLLLPADCKTWTRGNVHAFC